MYNESISSTPVVKKPDEATINLFMNTGVPEAMSRLFSLIESDAKIITEVLDKMG